MIGPCDPSPGLPFESPYEPGIEYFNASASGHRRLGSTPSEPLPSPPELGQHAARHDQIFQCTYSNVRRFLAVDPFLESASCGVVARCKIHSQATF